MIFKFKEDLRSELFIRVPRFYIEKKFWANLPASSKAIYPIIFKHSNADGVSFPSQLTIAILAGVTEKTVRDGLAGLEGFPEYKRTRYYTNRGHIAYKYAITPSSKNIRLFSPISEIDGFLIGGASQSSKKFIDIIKNYYK